MLATTESQPLKFGPVLSRCRVSAVLTNGWVILSDLRPSQHSRFSSSSQHFARWSMLAQGRRAVAVVIVIASITHALLSSSLTTLMHFPSKRFHEVSPGARPYGWVKSLSQGYWVSGRQRQDSNSCNLPNIQSGCRRLLVTFLLPFCKGPCFSSAREAWDCSSRLEVEEHPREEKRHVRHRRPGAGRASRRRH